MTRPSPRLSLLVALVVLTGCNSRPTASDPGAREQRDQARLRLSLEPAQKGLSVAAQAANDLLGADPGGKSVEAGRTLFVLAESSCVETCARATNFSCSIDVKGTELTVHTLLRYDLPTNTACPDMCRNRGARCETPKLEAGTYTLRFAGQSLQQSVPGTLNTAILEGT